MCLGIPGRILKHPGRSTRPRPASTSRASFGTINLSLLADEPAHPGEWVLIHLGFALQKMTEAEVAEMNTTRDFLFTGVGAPPDLAIDDVTTLPSIGEPVA